MRLSVVKIKKSGSKLHLKVWNQEFPFDNDFQNYCCKQFQRINSEGSPDCQRQIKPIHVSQPASLPCSYCATLVTEKNFEIGKLFQVGKRLPEWFNVRVYVFHSKVDSLIPRLKEIALPPKEC